MKKIFFALLALAAFTAAYAQEQTAQKTVAVVVPFDSSGVPQEEMDVVYRMFLSEFVRTGKCTVVDRSSFDKIRAQQNFQLSDWSNNDKVAKLGKALNANVVVTGQAMRFRAQVMFIVQILDVNSTEIISSSDERVGDVDELFSRFPAMCQELTKNLSKPQNGVAGKYEIGDIGPGGGIVFYVEGNKSYEVSEMLGVATWDGAFGLCNNYRGGGYDDWHLPTKDELNLIWKNLRKARKISGEDWYWSSSQSSSSYAWAQWFIAGNQISKLKVENFCVRAVRAF
ncbi:MAG: DUF1566 domain-containing protein [Treponema sp.]|nr:DUF1566 domain-containing protein [Treponema sp.]